jgi:hypothetical protein
MRPSDFVPWEGELLLGFPSGTDAPPALSAPHDPRAPADTLGWDGPWIVVHAENGR